MPRATRASTRSSVAWARPPITVPTIVLHGADDSVSLSRRYEVTWNSFRQRLHGMSWPMPAISCRVNNPAQS